MPAYEDLMSFQSQTEALAQISGRQDWDQETMMPSGAADQRGEESAAMEGVMHARRSDPRIGDWLTQCEDADLDAVARAQLRHIRHRYDRTCKVPARLDRAGLAHLPGARRGRGPSAPVALPVALERRCRWLGSGCVPQPSFLHRLPPTHP